MKSKQERTVPLCIPLESVGGPMVTISGGHILWNLRHPPTDWIPHVLIIGAHRGFQEVHNLLVLSVELCTFWKAPSRRVPSENKAKQQQPQNFPY